MNQNGAEQINNATDEKIDAIENKMKNFDPFRYIFKYIFKKFKRQIILFFKMNIGFMKE